MLRSSIQRELNDFCRKIQREDYSIQEVSASAFTQSRAKLKAEAFVELSDELIRNFYKDAPYLRWGEFRVLACDGSTLQLPNSKDIQRKFPMIGFGRNADANKSMARISMLYDVFNCITLDSKLEDFKVHETALLRAHLSTDKFMENDLLLLDRGYASAALFFELKQKGIHYCARLKDNWWLPVSEMLANGETDKIVTFTLPKKDQGLAPKYNTTEISFEARIVIITLENGTKEVLATSLIDKEDVTIEDLEWLYKQRWSEEEAYKLLKCRVDVERFSGKSVLSIYQDFYASIFMMNLSAALCLPVKEKIEKEGKQHRKYDRQINKTNAISFLTNSAVGLFYHKMIEPFFRAFDLLLHKTVDIIRPGRKNPRKHRPKKPKSNAYKCL